MRLCIFERRKEDCKREVDCLGKENRKLEETSPRKQEKEGRRRKQDDMHRCLLSTSITTCRLNDIGKEVLHYFPDLFDVVCTYSS